MFCAPHHPLTRILDMLQHGRFGFRYIETLLELQGRRIEVVNLADNGTEDLLQDLVAIIYSFCVRLYGQRRAKRKTEKITQALESND